MIVEGNSPINFIKQCLEENIDRDVIRQKMLASGWENQTIDILFNQIDHPESIVPPIKTPLRKERRILLIPAIFGLLAALTIAALIILPQFI